MNYFTNYKKIKVSPIPEKILTSMTENSIKNLPIRDCGEAIVNFEKMIRERKSKIQIKLVWSKKDIPCCKLRKTVADKLIKIQEKLPENFALRIYDAHRPIALQKKLFEQIWKEISEKKPQLKGKMLYREVTNFIADPKNTPPHSTGGAVDLTIVNIKTGKELNMGTRIDAISDLSMTFHPKIKKKSLENRLILFNALSSEGFSNIASEWWHYSYGDQVWAANFGMDYAIYGSR